MRLIETEDGLYTSDMGFFFEKTENGYVVYDYRPSFVGTFEDLLKAFNAIKLDYIEEKLNEIYEKEALLMETFENQVGRKGGKISYDYDTDEELLVIKVNCEKDDDLVLTEVAIELNLDNVVIEFEGE